MRKKGKRKKKEKESSDSELVFLDTNNLYVDSQSQISRLSIEEKITSDNDSSSSDDSSSSSDSSYIDAYSRFCKNSVDSVKVELKEESKANLGHCNIRIIDSDQSVLPSDKIIIVKSKIPIKIFLPEYQVQDETEISSGRYLKIKNKNYNVDVYIIPATGNTINELTSYTLRGKKRIEIIYAGSTWMTI